MPVFSSFSSGLENRETMGIKICGVTEQMPVTKDPARSITAFVEK